MRCYLIDKGCSVHVDDEMFNVAKRLVPIIDETLKRIQDKKDQLKYNAEFYVENTQDYHEFYRVFTATSLIFGAMLRLSINLYVNKYNKDASSLSTTEVVASNDYLATIKSEKFISDFDEIIKMEVPKNLSESKKSLYKLAKDIEGLIFSKNLSDKVDEVFRLKDEFLEEIVKKQISIEEKAQRALVINLLDTNQKVYLNFNGQKEEFEILDNWLSTVELKLNKYKASNEFEVRDIDGFLNWFNTFRLRLDCETSYKTLIGYFEMFENGSNEKYILNLTSKIQKLTEQGGSASDIRLRVLDYLHNILNKRTHTAKQEFKNLNKEDFKQYFQEKHNAYILSLYT